MRMSKIVRTGACILYPLITIFGLYVVVHGHLTPGGGFQGGAVIATAAALVLVAFSHADIAGMVRKTVFSAQESLGLLLFIGAGILGLLAGAPFFANILANSGLLFGLAVPPGSNPGDLNTAGVIPIMNIAVGVEVWGGLAIILMYLFSATGGEGA
ncbi:MAG TPA: MnhB domain-containing protein [Methanolinea sp.]|nr:MnhB domain-containing protein [Methanolinea sp.]HPC55188.1 MnhB domain-containing protein [Methanolinea sp.]HQE85223.1 MnhB domain-containing protein [Methanolinea sp.]HQI14232.1 MnhB domain-containing protein [Methanolinea sp.]HQJ18327.1 MnhB domain-containing protein [Methanolinea sp.]